MKVIDIAEIVRDARITRNYSYWNQLYGKVAMTTPFRIESPVYYLKRTMNDVIKDWVIKEMNGGQ